MSVEYVCISKGKLATLTATVWTVCPVPSSQEAQMPPLLSGINPFVLTSRPSISTESQHDIYTEHLPEHLTHENSIAADVCRFPVYDSYSYELQDQASQTARLDDPHPLDSDFDHYSVGNSVYGLLETPSYFAGPPSGHVSRLNQPSTSAPVYSGHRPDHADGEWSPVCLQA
jgi:hypothetical protein